MDSLIPLNQNWSLWEVFQKQVFGLINPLTLFFGIFPERLALLLQSNRCDFAVFCSSKHVYLHAKILGRFTPNLMKN